jgi:sortase A
MKRVIGKTVLYTSILALLASAGWFAYNRWDDNRAGQNAALITEGILGQIRRPVSVLGAEPEPDGGPFGPGAAEDDKLAESIPKSVEFDGELYIGILSIPSLSLELPVNKELHEAALKNSPCRYTGGFSGSLVISAHNYRNHFGALSSLLYGDTAAITDVGGNEHQYMVKRVEILHEAEVDAMVNSPYDLTLFTCTRSRTERVAVRFMKTGLNGDRVIEVEPGAPKAPNFRINYRDETIRIRKGYLYSTDGGASFVEVTEARGVMLDISDNITNGTNIYIRKAATIRRPASHPQIIRPGPREPRGA